LPRVDASVSICQSAADVVTYAKGKVIEAAPAACMQAIRGFSYQLFNNSSLAH